MFCTSPGSLHEVVSLEKDPYLEFDNMIHGTPMNKDPFWLPSMNNSPSGYFVGKDVNFWSGEGFNHSMLGPNSRTSTFCTSPPLSSTGTGPGAVHVAAESQQFQEHYIPPKAPSSEHFVFAPTTLFLESCAPHDTANRLMDFLTSEVVASVRKVRPEKYSINAEVFVEAASCTIKVRMYSHDGKYAVEVQRRSGDVFVLNSTYCLLEAFLEADGAALLPASGMQASTLLLPQLDTTQQYADVQSLELIAPVLKLGAFSGLQSEASCTLAAVAKGGHSSAAALLSAPTEVATILTDLLASESLDTVYPATQCISALATYNEADAILAHPGLLQKMTLQAVAELETSYGLVGTALAHTVADALHCCGGSLTKAAAKELQHLLDDAMNHDMLKANIVARSHLEQAVLHTHLLLA